MKKSSLIILIFTSIALLSAASWFAYQYFFKNGPQVHNPIDAVPDNHAFIVKFESLQSMDDILSLDTSFLPKLITDSNYEAFASKRLSLRDFLQNDQELSALLDQSPCLISSHFMGLDKFHTLLTLPLPRKVDEEKLMQLMKQIGEVKKSGVNNYPVYHLKTVSEKAYYFTHYKGIFQLSQSLALIKKSLLQMDEGEPITKKPMVKRMLKISDQGKIHVYINHDYLYRFIAQYTPEYRESVKLFRKLAARTEFDAQLDNTMLLLRGYSIFSDTIESYGNLLQKHKPVKVKLFSMLPYNSVYVEYKAADDLPLLIQDFSQMNPSNSPTRLKEIEEKYKISMTELIYSWLGREMAYVWVSNGNQKDPSPLLFLSVTDIKEAEHQLNSLREKVLLLENEGVDTIQYRSYPIHKIPIPNLLSNVYSVGISGFSTTYYTSIGDHIVFGSNYESLKAYIDAFLIGQFISTNPTFNSFAEHRSDHMNLYYYIEPNEIPYFKDIFLGPKYDSLLTKGLKLNKLAFVSLEFSAEENGVFTSLIAAIGSGVLNEEEMPVSWQEALDADVYGEPKIFTNHNSGKKELLVFDVEHNLYRIDEAGNIQWKIPISERPISEIALVDFYKNGKYQYIFNTANFIHIVDLNGNRLDAYPFELPAPAIGSMSLMDYDKNLNYRILVPLADGKLHNFKLDKKSTSGWINPDFSPSSIAPVNHYRLGSKDFLLMTDTAGNVLFANRRGEVRIEAKLAFTNNTKTDFYVLGKGSNARLITTDMLGRIISIDQDGNVVKEELENFSTHHRFYMADYNFDGSNDYVFIDNQRIKVFEKDKHKILDTLLGDVQISSLQSLRYPTEDSIAFILHNSKQNTLILLGSQGKIVDTGEFESNDDFVVDQATKNGYLRLITVNGRVISNFLIK